MTRRQVLTHAAAGMAAGALELTGGPTGSLLDRAAAAGNEENTRMIAERADNWAEMRGKEGYFRVARENSNRWWLLDPVGKPFFYRGVCAINRAGTQGGRFAVPGPYAEAVDRKYRYHEQGPDAFVEATLKRLRAWGFNALGAWTTVEFFDRGMPYTEILEFSKVGPNLRDGGGENAPRGPRLPDVFSPVWELEGDRLARELCAPRRMSRNLIGYFTDNEIGWAQPKGMDRDDNPETTPPPTTPTLLQYCLALEPEWAAHQAAWKFARERHSGDIARALSAWECDARNVEDFVRFHRGGGVLSNNAYREDHIAFSEQFAERYFAGVSRAIRRYDPNHLILGCRFGGPPGVTILRAARPPFVDILSANNYQHAFQERLEFYHEPTRMPILNGEFAWASGYFTDLMIPGEPAEEWSGRERAQQKAAPALRSGAAHPALVGYTWYRWVSRAAAPDGVTYGLVDLEDNEDTFNTRLLAQVNPTLEAVHRAGTSEPVPGIEQPWKLSPKKEAEIQARKKKS
ncbi:MAG: hypothetical protein OHK0029_16950 [Armatimonadaceae bacterium]